MIRKILLENSPVRPHIHLAERQSGRIHINLTTNGGAAPNGVVIPVDDDIPMVPALDSPTRAAPVATPKSSGCDTRTHCDKPANVIDLIRTIESDAETDTETHRNYILSESKRRRTNRKKSETTKTCVPTPLQSNSWNLPSIVHPLYNTLLVIPGFKPGAYRTGVEEFAGSMEITLSMIRFAGLQSF